MYQFENDDFVVYDDERRGVVYEDENSGVVYYDARMDTPSSSAGFSRQSAQKFAGISKNSEEIPLDDESEAEFPPDMEEIGEEEMKNLPKPWLIFSESLAKSREVSQIFSKLPDFLAKNESIGFFSIRNLDIGKAIEEKLKTAAESDLGYASIRCPKLKSQFYVSKWAPALMRHLQDKFNYCRNSNMSTFD